MALAHVASLRFPEFSVKVARHTNWDYFCGRLWKKVGAPLMGSQTALSFSGTASTFALAVLHQSG